MRDRGQDGTVRKRLRKRLSHSWRARTVRENKLVELQARRDAVARRGRVTPTIPCGTLNGHPSKLFIFISGRALAVPSRDIALASTLYAKKKQSLSRGKNRGCEELRLINHNNSKIKINVE